MVSVLRRLPPRAAAVPPPPRLPADGAWCCDGDDDGVPATACLPAPGGWRRAWATAAGALLAVAAAALVGLALGSLTAPAHAQGVPGTQAAARPTGTAPKPAAIRIGFAAAPVGQPPVSSGNAVAIAHWKGWLEEEFRADGIAVQWYFFRGAGPAVNESLSTGQLDFAAQGDVPAVVARAGGLGTRLLMASGARNNLYVAVPPDSPLRSVAELRGKRVALFKGTSGQLPANRLLARHGLAEKDLRAINLDYAAMQAALATRDIDAAFGGMELLKLRDQGAARILYTSRDDSPVFTRQNHVLVTEAFERAHPALVQRVVDVLVRAAHWGSETANREDVLRQWGRGGTPYEAWREDLLGQPLKVRLSPLFDPLMVGLYQDASRQLREFRLTRREIDVERWIDRRYLDRALRSQGLQDYWPRLDAQGRQAS
ncbi:MAG: ABC transporter substrate-binding protein [Xylophilus ampelinus]